MEHLGTIPIVPMGLVYLPNIYLQHWLSFMVYKSKKIYHTLPKNLAALDGIPKGNFIFQGFCFRGKLLTRKASTRHTFGIGNAEVCRFLKSGGMG